MTPPRRAKLVLLVLAVALVGLGVWAWEPVQWLWWRVTARRVVGEGTIDWGEGPLRIRGWYFVRKIDGVDSFGPDAFYYVETGFKAWDIVRLSSNSDLGEVFWNSNGGVLCQGRPPQGPRKTLDLSVDYYHKSPPWLWGVTDQTSPSIPEWMKDDAQWQAALNSQK